MEGMLSKCGYRCNRCLAYEANFKGEVDQKRMSDALAKYYDFEIPPEEVKACRGCQASETPPDSNCPVFPCARERGLETCGHCPDFGCDKLKQRMDVVEKCLEKHSDMPQEDFDTFFKPYLSRRILEQIHQNQES